MLYEARRPARLNYILAILCASLSIIGFFVAGIIPSASTANGAYPLTGLGIIMVCLAPAVVFLRRARDNSVIIRADADGLYSRQYSDATIPWSAIAGVKILRFKNQSVLRVKLHDKAAWPCKSRLGQMIGALDNALSYGDFGINPSYYDHGMRSLVAAVQHYRPDLLG
jgi:hypothetical protein